MEVVPVTVGQVSRSWDDQRNDVAAAAGQVGGVSTCGFTAGVAGTAARFAATWQRHTLALADRAEAQADALRGSIADFLGTDEAVGFEVVALQGYLVEQR